MRASLLQVLLLGTALASAACSEDTPVVGGPNGGDPNGPGQGDGDNPGPGGGDGDWTGGGDGDGTLPPPVLGGTSVPFHEDRTGQSGLDAGTINDLKDGGGACNVSVVYPYNNTVFPGGLLPPPIMWTGGGEAAYVHLSYVGVDTLKYEFAAKVTNGELTIPHADWLEITRRTQNTDLLVKLSVKKGGAVGTCNLNWRVAQGNMVGAVYYNTYNHPDTLGVGAVLRLALGAQQPVVYQKSDLGAPPTGPCRSCHSVSFDGSMLVSSEHGYGLGSAFFKVTSHRTGQTPQPAQLADLKDPAFGALTPDGKYLLQMGNPQCTNGALTFPRAPNNFMLVPGPVSAGLIDTATGQVVQSTGLDSNSFMWMPQFSPNGDKVVFNNARLVNGKTDRHELAIMDFDQTTRTFSNLRVISTRQDTGVTRSLYEPRGGPGELAGAISQSCTPALGGGGPFGIGETSTEWRAAMPDGSCSGPCYPAWPFFTPDGNGVIYSLISEPDFAVAFPGRDKSAKSELWYVDVNTKERVRLDNANKVLGQGGLDNYYPTVLPVQVGGYYWVFFTSMRQWGTRVYKGNELDAITFGPSAVEAIKKRLWVSAIKPRATPGSGEFEEGKLTDPSMPAFYLEGQSNTGNTRAFAALNPCKTDGNTCTSGLDCCSGFCDINEGKTEGVCVPEVTCSSLNEKCETDEDCCPPAEGETKNTCIAGYCGFLIF